MLFIMYVLQLHLFQWDYCCLRMGDLSYKSCKFIQNFTLFMYDHVTNWNIVALMGFVPQIQCHFTWPLSCTLYFCTINGNFSYCDLTDVLSTPSHPNEGGWGEGCFLEFWMRVCALALQALTLSQTKMLFFITYCHTWSLESIPVADFQNKMVKTDALFQTKTAQKS